MISQAYKKNLKKVVKILVLPTIGIIYYYLFTNGIYIKCIFHEITGLYCPGCGISRMFVSIIQLDFTSAFKYNPVVFIMLPIILPYITYIYYIWAFEKKDEITKKIPNKLLYLIVIILVIFGILRNINCDWLLKLI